MTKVTFISHDGIEQVIDAQNGRSLMEAAMQNNVRGIDADCGGTCSCATCHVYVAEDWAERLVPAEGMEEIMLDFAEHVEATSRLSCQIQVTPEMDGLVVRLPESQH